MNSGGPWAAVWTTYKVFCRLLLNHLAQDHLLFTNYLFTISEPLYPEGSGQNLPNHFSPGDHLALGHFHDHLLFTFPEPLLYPEGSGQILPKTRPQDHEIGLQMIVKK